MPTSPTPAPSPPRSTSAPAKGEPPKVAAKSAATGAETPPTEAEEEALEEEQSPVNGRFLLFNATPSWAVSAVVHFVMFIILALIPQPEREKSDVTTISATPPEVVEEIEEFKSDKIELNLDPTTAIVTNASSEAIQSLTSDIAEVTETPIVASDVEAAPISVELSEFGEAVAPKNSLTKQIGAYGGTGLDSRSPAMRAQLGATSGANEASERSVARALEWFAKHQLPDGGWNFDHRLGPCNGRCSEPGRLSDCRTGATAMALLPFLGAGQTHKEGKYKEVVTRGLYFLTAQMKQKNMGGMVTGDLAQGGGQMYSHGLSAIVLCEAYAMTQDAGLRGPAQLSLNHIMYAQDPVGGGWRYQPRQPGDTSVVGWQLMALKSGHMAYLQVDPRTIKGATHFLDSVQIESGAKYGYVEPGGGQATTAVGLLCRMYLGWKKDHPALKRGVEQMSAWGPSGSKGGGANMYYNYYATQVMRHYEGETWDKWNKEMRDWLISSQESNDKQHSFGSWHINGDHGADSGGRIYCTSLATMILEVYYRHMPLYAKQAAEDEFPLK
jgi:hypothetical protein